MVGEPLGRDATMAGMLTLGYLLVLCHQRGTTVCGALRAPTGSVLATVLV
jgi:hypothetical protein